MQIEKVFNEDEKAEICLRILHALPDWFAVEASVLDYAAQVREQSFSQPLMVNSQLAFAA